MTCNLYSSIEAAKEAMEKLSTETKEYFERQTELINKAFTGDEQTTETKPEIKAIVVHHFLKNDTIKDLEKDKKMKAKLILDDGREIVLGILNQLDEPEVNSQIDKLANFIMSEVEGEPSQSQGAVDTAIRIIKSYQNQDRNIEK